MLRHCVYPGSFDPVTIGHVDIIHRLSRLFDRITVLVAHSSQKNYLFSAEERRDLVLSCMKGLKNVSVEIHEGLTVEFAQKTQAQVVIRGLRAVSDFEYEQAMANVNAQLAPGVETLIVFTRPEYGHISSRLVKEVAQFGGDLKDLVPTDVAQALRAKFA